MPAPCSPSDRTARDQAIAELARRGVAHKVIAIELAVSPSTVSNVLTRLAARIGVQSRVQWIARLAPTHRPPRDLSCLTAAEHATVRLILAGLSNAEIGDARGVASRTVANQIASTYEKLGIHSRAELAALSGEAPYS